jgi:hypothetical protein
MKNTPFLVVKYTYQHLLVKDKPLLFSCEFLFSNSARDLLILPRWRSCQVSAPPVKKRDAVKNLNTSYEKQ